MSLCEAVYEGETTVEGLRAVRIDTLEQAPTVWAQNAVPVLIDPAGSCVAQAKPDVLVDVINGRVLYKDREFVGIDEEKINAWTMAESKKLWSALNNRTY